MGNWSDLKQAVAQVIRENGNQEITGQILQYVLNSIISNVGQYATFVDIATPSTNPGTPDGNVFYIASQAGNYANFHSISLDGQDICILLYNGTTWTAKSTGAATKALTINAVELTALDFDIYTIGKIITANVPCRFAVTKKGISVGLLDCYSDENNHMFTQEFTTHYLLPFTGNSTSHTDDITYKYVRSYHIAGGSSSITQGTWGEWKQVYSSDNQKDVDALKTSVNNLNANTGIDEYEEFSDQKEYPAGYTLMKDGLLYTFITDHAAGAWNPEEVEGGSVKKEVERKTRHILSTTATTDKSDVIENSIIELKIFKDENTKAYINSFTGDTAVVKREFIIKTSDGSELCSKSSCVKTNVHDNVWIYENENLRAVIDFGTNNDYIINEGSNNSYEKTGINSVCFIKNKYYYNSINNIKKDISDTESSLTKKIDDNKNVYQDEVISGAWVVTGKAISVKNGEEVDLENAKSTDYIPIGVGALQITQDEIIGYYSGLYGIAAYNSEKKFIKGWSGYPDITPNIILPEDTAYIRTCTTLGNNRTFKIKNNVLFGSKNNLIVKTSEDLNVVKEDVETLKEVLDTGNKPAHVIEPFKTNTYIVANVGYEPIYSYYKWCNTYRIDVNKGDAVWVYNAYVNQNRPTWATLDNTGKVVRRSEFLKYGYTRRIVIEEGEVALIWTQPEETGKGTYLIENNDSYLLSEGELLNLSADKIQTDSVNAQIVQSKSEVGGTTMFVAKSIDASSEINIKISDNELFFVGIWFYMPTSIQKNIESIIIDGAEKKSLSFSACDIQLMTKYLPVTGSERTITIKVSLKEGVNNTDLIFGGIIKNQIVKPVVILDFDSTYQYSEDEGVYSWILEQAKLPMTIYVGELAKGSDGNITDWQKYINSGQVDIGTYGGSINLHPTDWSGTDALKHDPYGEKCPNISDIKNNIDKYMNTFIDNYSVFPLSFGGQQYYCPKKAQKVILSNGYKTTRLPTGIGSDQNISFGVSYAKDRLIYGDSGYGLNKINGVVRNLGVFNYFNHGLSDDHAGEGIYTSFSAFKEDINQLINLYNEGTLLFINYSMYYKILVDNNLIVDSTFL